jgi:hypothetical protein
MALQDFWNGVTCKIVDSLPNPDEGRSKYRAIESTLVSIFSKIIDPNVLIAAFSDNNETLIIRELRQYGISELEFARFTHLIGEAKDPNTEEKDSFAQAQYLLIGMFRKKLETRVALGEIDKGVIRPAMTKFGLSLYGKDDLRNALPLNNISYLRLSMADTRAALNHNIKLAQDNCEHMYISTRVRAYPRTGREYEIHQQLQVAGRQR